MPRAASLRGHLEQLEQAFATTLRHAQAESELRGDLDAGDTAQLLLSATQGMALLRLLAPG